MKRIINFSGGLSSAYMTILEYNPETDIVVFCDTGREHDKTYEFIDQFEVAENIPIVRLGSKTAFTDFLSKRNYDYIPNRTKRSCTIELKIKTARRYARQVLGMEYNSLIGFRYDEEIRVSRYIKKWKKVTPEFPLYDRGITKYMVNQYWKNKPYTLEIPNILGNCTLCMMKGKDAVINILRQYPELAEPWITDEKNCQYGYTYLKDISIEECLKIAQMPDLFKKVDLNKITPAFNCSCTS